MIKKTEKKTLQKHLKKDWVDDVLEELAIAQVVNKKGQPYSESMLRMVFNGHRENLDIETAILTVYHNRKTLMEKKETQKKELLSA